MTKPIKSKETPASKAVRPKPDTPVKTKTSKTASQSTSMPKPKSAVRTADKPITQAPSTARTRRSPVRTKKVVTVPTRDQIAELAYHLFLARGGRHGQDLDDWFEAERRLLGGQS
ncbi:MAG TPA: DUF2934 domain-containing protein [Polyangiaceae bacterium]|jgi:hypothetical protein|nr:MAG: hypothetical protein BWY17_02052 [Deltaproteobacteria bacterium ADurb.Bin207]HNS99763.1 DUF2934 domain-containing protein [Polyangiaceae bacterium]HNZ24184.1 DUF2934 domain-containing protein [Polyangiaceae bacterium]HOD22541.1 DUF2934 domain-containing protein [Polyangiaceae bacterium]HOE49463.1 DUF2934 domain-containing protein [Polyangiaceae bacterium]